MATHDTLVAMLKLRHVQQIRRFEISDLSFQLNDDGTAVIRLASRTQPDPVRYRSSKNPRGRHPGLMMQRPRGRQ
jgi:hypothetical protein